MSHQVIWTRRVFEFFADAGNLSPLEREIMETRIAGMSRVEQSQYFCMSLSSLDRTIARIKKIYDDAIYAEVLKQAQKASATVDFPLIGSVTYSSKDVEQLYRFIVG